MPPPENENIRAVEVIASVCLATDLAMGFPFEQGFEATLMTSRLCDILGVETDVKTQAHYVCMLTYTGCTADVARGVNIFGSPQMEAISPHVFGSRVELGAAILRALPPPDVGPIERGIQVARRLPRVLGGVVERQRTLCEVAEMLTRRLGLPSEIFGLFVFLTERWDGKGLLKRAEGDEIPQALQIALQCRDAALQRHVGGDAHAAEVIRARAGGAFDPAIASAFLDHYDEITSVIGEHESSWQGVLEAEPKPWIMLRDEEIDRALAAVGDFSDLVAPSFAGHSSGVSRLASRAAHIAGLDQDTTTTVRRAALVHDVGRSAVSSRIWQKPEALNRDEHEQVRLHPYQTERILDASPYLSDLATTARDHHEKLDGSGYHRGVRGPALNAPARLLGAADIFHAMTEPRPYRDALASEDAAKLLVELANRGQLDHAMVSAVLEAAGEEVRDMERPGGLTEREAEVIGLLARGLQTKQIATALGISPKTADTHIQSGYRKMGVSTRASATLFAMEHGLIPSGELPIDL